MVARMLLNLNQIGQISLPTADVERTEAFYGGVLGVRKLYRFGDLTFFDCAGVRLLFEKVVDPAAWCRAAASTSAAPTSRLPSRN